MEGERCSPILILIGEADFLTLIEKVDFLILFVTKDEDTQILMSLGSLLLIGILILSHSYFGVMKLINCLT